MGPAAKFLFLPTFLSLAHAHVIILRDEIITLQNNRCIGPIHAVDDWTKRCARHSRHSHGVGSKPNRGIFGNIFIDFFFFFFYFINKNNQCNVCKYKYYLTTHTHMSEVEVYSVNKLTFWVMDKNVVGKKISRPGSHWAAPDRRCSIPFKCWTPNRVAATPIF